MKIRQVSVDDMDTIAGWIADDPDHRSKNLQPQFFLTPLGLMFEDDCGPVFAVVLEAEIGGADDFDTVRIHIQFNATQVLRTARMLKEGFPVVEDRARVAGARRLVFDSVSSQLIEFCKRRFGFTEVKGTEDLELELNGEPDGSATAVC